MARIKIDYGIDLGTTNSAIARMESGEPIIKKSLDLQKDTVPSCISISKKGVIEVGDKALNQLGVDKRLQSQNTGYQSNVFIEFKRTMGTDKSYYSSNLDKMFTSDELSSEVLKKLKQPISDETVNAVVITVPAKFGVNQKEATKKAAELAGFTQCELVSEPVAAAYAYSIKSKIKDGFWIVFDFGGGTFDAALLKIEDGIFNVVSTEGDNYLGGKNLDYAIVDEILLPYFKENYHIDSVNNDDEKLGRFRNQFKDKAEQLKISLTSKTEEDLISQLGENFGNDDDGTPFEFDLRVTREQLNMVQQPYFQNAIDITKELLKRNNLKGSQIDALILVGGPTLTPLLREMLKDQITDKVDTSVDPMTVVAKGAALFASTINRVTISKPSFSNYVDLEIHNESTSIQTKEFVTVKWKNQDKFENDKIYAEIHRSDGGWSSSRIELGIKAKIFEVVLMEATPNNFKVKTYNSKGDFIECSPNEFTILQGIGDGDRGNVILPYYYGVEVKNSKTDRMEFAQLKGLEKDRKTPATGVCNNLKTSSQIRPGMKQDFLKIPLYQGNNNAKGSRAIYNDHVFDIEISGEDLPALLPEGSTFDLTVLVDRSEGLRVKANFHKLDYLHELTIDKDKRQAIPSIQKIESEFRDGFRIIKEIIKSGVLSDNSNLLALESQLSQLQEYFEKGKSDDDRRKEVFDKMREILIKVDDVDKGTSWDRLEKEIREEFGRLEKANEDLGNEKTSESVKRLHTRVDQIIRSKDEDLGRDVLEEIESLFFGVTLIYQLIGRIKSWNDRFNHISWNNPQRVRQLLNQGLQIIAQDPSEEKLLPIVIECENNLPDRPCPNCGGIIGKSCTCVTM